MKKTLLIFAVLFVSVSSNSAFATSQSFSTSDGIYNRYLNINAYVDVNIYGSFTVNNPNAPDYYTYWDFGAYRYDGSSGHQLFIYTYPFNDSSPSFYRSFTGLGYWETLQLVMDISNGTGSYTAEWY